MLGYQPPRPETPWTRHPLDQTPPGPGAPPDQTPQTRPDTPQTQTRHPPQNRYTPSDQVHLLGQSTPPRPGTPPWDQTPPGTRHTPQPPIFGGFWGFFGGFFFASLPPGSRLWHRVNERPVHILLECILVSLSFICAQMLCESIVIEHPRMAISSSAETGSLLESRMKETTTNL